MISTLNLPMFDPIFWNKMPSPNSAARLLRKNQSIVSNLKHLHPFVSVAVAEFSKTTDRFSSKTNASQSRTAIAADVL